jgi:hypothetical protein
MTDEATPEVLAAQKAFNLSTGWFAAFPVGEHVVIVVTPYQAERLAQAYRAFTASSDQGIPPTFAPVGLSGAPSPLPTDEPSRPGDGHIAG